MISLKNPLLKEIRRALVRGTLTGDGYAVAETFHLLEEALRSDCQVGTVLAAESVRPAVEQHVRKLRGVQLVILPDRALEQLATTESSQGVIALVKPPSWTMEQVLCGHSLVVVLDGIQDPGNAGTILRAGEAFGATGALLLKGTVSPFNPKTLRASAGSIFRLPVAWGVDTGIARAAMAQKKLQVFAAVPGAAMELQDAAFTRPCAIIVGSEGRGVSKMLRSAAMDVSIPTVGVESLNAAMAASVMLYEASRQRRSANR
ncbi:MAG: RNA methyltransferase [Bryobacteraceae bacterium]|nr:RNA methyltransferase [Bryobacteraceae bacterium]